MIKKLKLVFYYLFKYPFYKLTLGSIGHKARLLSTTIDGGKHIFIGNRVYVNSYGWLACLPLTGDAQCSLHIGEGTYIGRFCHIYAVSQIDIGKKVLIADKVYIADNLHQFTDINLPVIDQPVKQTSTVIIGDGAWLGENVCIIGAKVGKHAVIGANAVVMKDIPDYCVAVGSPAKIIKRYSMEENKWLPTDNKGEFI